jgi:hypothetical protein
VLFILLTGENLLLYDNDEDDVGHLFSLCAFCSGISDVRVGDWERRLLGRESFCSFRLAIGGLLVGFMDCDGIRIVAFLLGCDSFFVDVVID